MNRSYKVPKLLRWMFCIFCAVATIEAQRNPVAGTAPVELKGNVVKIERMGSDTTPSGVKITIKYTLRNVSDESIIFYSQSPWAGAYLVAKSAHDLEKNDLIASQSSWPGLWGRKTRIEKYNLLNGPSPPPELTKILKPGDTWTFESKAGLTICGKDSNTSCERGIRWAESRNASLYLETLFEMWPVNVEPSTDPDNPSFGLELQKRWEKSGKLWLDYLASQPIELDLHLLH